MGIECCVIRDPDGFPIELVQQPLRSLLHVDGRIVVQSRSSALEARAAQVQPERKRVVGHDPFLERELATLECAHPRERRRRSAPPSARARAQPGPSRPCSSRRRRSPSGPDRRSPVTHRDAASDSARRRARSARRRRPRQGAEHRPREKALPSLRPRLARGRRIASEPPDPPLRVTGLSNPVWSSSGRAWYDGVVHSGGKFRCDPLSCRSACFCC